MPDDDQQTDPITAESEPSSNASEPDSSSQESSESGSTAEPVVDVEIVDVVGGVGKTELVEVEKTELVEKVELTEDQVKELLSQLNDSTPGPEAPTETYTHPVTGREVYVPKSQKNLGPTAAISTMALLMFVGGGLATLMMVARAFDLHGDVLVSFVIGSCAVILGMAGGLLLKTLGDKWWVGAVVGACFGVIGGILIYAQTSHHAWWH